jgi:MerR family transcriptional regulator, light-induced transcriptional regulator
MDRLRRDEASQGDLNLDAQDCRDLLGDVGPPRKRDRSSGSPSPFNAAGERMSQLALTIEREIIPRLMLAHRAVTVEAPAPTLQRPVVQQSEVQAFAKLALAQDDGLASVYVDQLMSRGLSVERVYLDLLGPAAQYLGLLWEQDLCDFTEVTVGLGRLQRVMRELSPAFGKSVEYPANGRRVLLLPSPGEQHTFGLVMVGEFFRRSGWDVSGGAWESGAEAPDMVASEWFDVVGLSLGAEIHLDALQQCIKAIREASRNRDIAIMVGGPIFGARPECVAQVGADGMASDGLQAPALAEQAILRRCQRA